MQSCSVKVHLPGFYSEVFNKIPEEQYVKLQLIFNYKIVLRGITERETYMSS